MHDTEKSDFGIVAMRPTNKAGSPAAELVEPRPETKGNVDSRLSRGIGVFLCLRGDCQCRAAFGEYLSTDIRFHSIDARDFTSDLRHFWSGDRLCSENLES